MAEWTTEYINDLPDEAFAVIEPAYKRGETEDKRCRHLPHHSAGVKDGDNSNDHIDIDHLRNAWQRRKQLKPVTDSISQEELIARAEQHLKKHIKDLELGWAEESRIRMIDDDTIELIPGQFSLSKTGEGMIRLVAPLNAQIIPPQAAQESVSPAQSTNEFLIVRFRALSKIYIEDYALDFRKDDVLKKSAPLLKNQTVYTDHDVRINNWVGVVENSYWDESQDPPGVDADIKIDIISNPKIARGLSISPPAIHSASVTTFFLWSKSHPEMPDNEFFAHLGEEVNGEIVRIIIDEILQYGELSLVWQGADPFAKRKFAQMRKKNQGGPLDTQQQIKELQEQLTALQKQKDEAESQLASLKAEAELGKKYLAELRAETESLYRLLNQNKVNEDFIQLMIHQAPLEQLIVLKKDYERLLGEKLFFTCPHCGKQFKSLRASKEKEENSANKNASEEAKKYKITKE